MIREDHEVISEGSDRDLNQVQDQEDQEDLGDVWVSRSKWWVTLAGLGK